MSTNDWKALLKARNYDGLKAYWEDETDREGLHMTKGLIEYFGNDDRPQELFLDNVNFTIPGLANIDLDSKHYMHFENDKIIVRRDDVIIVYPLYSLKACLRHNIVNNEYREVWDTLGDFILATDDDAFCSSFVKGYTVVLPN